MMIITIDGPAASGKSTTARAVARQLGFRHLESGAFFRALTWVAIESSIPPEKWEELDEPDLEAFQIDARPSDGGFRITVGGADVTDHLRSGEVNAHVSHMAQLPPVRGWLLRRLRAVSRFAKPFCGEQDDVSAGLVTDGRDMGTVVFPDAELKIFLTARPDVRARRRLAEHGVKEPDSTQVESEIERLLERDRIDSQRKVAPLRRADDAVDVDTSDLSFQEQVDVIADLARERGASARSG